VGTIVSAQADQPVTDVAIVGAGAAGLAAAIFVRRANPARSVVLLDGARKPGAKILVSGGARCNVTNRIVTERDFWGGRRPLIRRVLRAFTADQAVRFFEALGVKLHEEAGGKLFPDSNRSRDVLDALVAGVTSAGVQLLADHRVLDVQLIDGGFRAVTTKGVIRCRNVVLATGGESLPKSGSDGTGFQFARRFGHTIVPTTPALVPLVLAETAGVPMHRALSGVSHDAELSLWVDGRITTRHRGSLLWTHFGISGPVTLNVSRHWLRAEREGRRATLTASFCPGESFERLETRWTATASTRPKSSVVAALATQLPASVAAALIERLPIELASELAHITRTQRRCLVRALLEWPLSVSGCRGYNHAEATAGGVTLDEVNPATMESRICPGLYLVGEMLDVDGRIGGFNFQWAWSTAFVAGAALGRATWWSCRS
jgi:predicted Rossmann fold flavoprotein